MLRSASRWRLRRRPFLERPVGIYRTRPPPLIRKQHTDRLFVAFSLPRSVRTVLSGVVPARPGLRIVPDANHHLTLRFIGSCERDDRDRLMNALSNIHFAPFSFQIRRIGVFPSVRRARVLYAGIEAGPELSLLQTEIEVAVQASTGRSSSPTFHPHITLARVSRPDKPWIRSFLRDHREFDGGIVEVTVFHLFSSTLSPAGSIYKSIASFPPRV